MEHKNCDGVLPVKNFIAELDGCFARDDLAAAGEVLSRWERLAREQYDRTALLSILSEEIGYYRQTADPARGVPAIEEAFSLIDELEIQDTVSAGTIYINGATTYKSFGMAERGMAYYDRAERIYAAQLPPDDYRVAALCNNRALALSDLGDTEAAERSFLRALRILRAEGLHDGEIAVTHIGLAHLYDKIGRRDGIEPQLESAWQILSSGELPRDGDFAFICSKCAPSYGYFGQKEREAVLTQIAAQIYGKH